MFGFMKKRIFKRMNNYVDHIELACYAKLLAQLKYNHKEEKAKLIAAAVSNQLFGEAPSPMHSHLQNKMIDQLASDCLTDDDEQLRYGIIMSLRTRMAIETDAHNTDATIRIGDTIQWIKTITPLPPEAPNPKIMLELAVTLRNKYCREQA